MIRSLSYPDPVIAAARAGEHLQSLLTGRELLLVSGGSALTVLKHADPGAATVGLIDERITLNASDRNSDKLGKVWEGIPVLAPGQEGSLEDIASAYERELRNYIDRPVIAVLGIGPDGHTGGILPHHTGYRPGQLVIGYEAPHSAFPRRVTVTFDLLRRVTAAVVYVCGEKKKAALEKTLARYGDLDKTPARILQEMRGVRLFTDVPIDG